MNSDDLKRSHQIAVNYDRAVPKRWEIARSDQFLATERRQVTPDQFRTADVIHYSIPNVQQAGTGLIEEGADIESAKQVIKEPSLLVSKLNPRKATICIARPGEKLTLASTEFVILIPRKADLGFLYYLCLSERFRQTLEATTQSVTRSHQRVQPEQISRFWAAWPPLPEQAAIAAFLDRESGKIDALVAEQERLIALLKEKRQAVISQAVTKGLDPAAPMKPSGVEWLGEMPSHWQLKPVKHVARLESGHTPSKQFAEYYEGGDIDWVSLNDTRQLAANDYISETAVKITPLGLANSSARLLPGGTVVFTRDATIGLAAITSKPMAVSQHLIAWLPSKQVSAIYLLRVFQVMRPFLEAATAGATIKTIGMPEVRKLLTPLPPPEEQAAIVEFLAEELGRLDALVGEAARAVALLKERRSALISAAVTGKIDVRNLVEPQAEQAEAA